jgi:hypothetical protein
MADPTTVDVAQDFLDSLRQFDIGSYQDPSSSIFSNPTSPQDNFSTSFDFNEISSAPLENNMYGNVSGPIADIFALPPNSPSPLPIDVVNQPNQDVFIGPISPSNYLQADNCRGVINIIMHLTFHI